MNVRNQVYGVTPSAHSPLVTVKNPKGARGHELLSITVVRATGRCGDTRAAERLPMVIAPAVLSSKRSRQAVQLINLCAGGAMIAADVAARLWDRVKLDLDDGRTFDCSVAWIKQGRIGLAFAEPQLQ